VLQVENAGMRTLGPCLYITQITGMGGRGQLSVWKKSRTSVVMACGSSQAA
jgi:hypothetical protein